MADFGLTCQTALTTTTNTTIIIKTSERIFILRERHPLVHYSFRDLENLWQGSLELFQWLLVTKHLINTHHHVVFAFNLSSICMLKNALSPIRSELFPIKGHKPFSIYLYVLFIKI